MARRRDLVPIKGKVTRLPQEDYDSLFPFHNQLANESPTIPPSHIPLLKPGLQVFYELVLGGHHQSSQPTYNKLLEKEQNDDDEQHHLTSRKFCESFIDAISPKDLRLHCGWFQSLFAGYKLIRGPIHVDSRFAPSMRLTRNNEKVNFTLNKAENTTISSRS